MKTCPKCKETKTDTEFYVESRRSDGLSSHCKGCKRKEALANKPTREGLAAKKVQCSLCKEFLPRNVFAKNSTGKYGLQKDCKPCRAKREEEYSRVQREWIADYKIKAQCADCPAGTVHPYWRLDFDHIRGTKLFHISGAGRQHKYTAQEIEEEIAKCEVVCANCHRDRTQERRVNQSSIAG